MKSVKSVFPGTFGDGKVIVRRCDPHSPNGVHVVLLHGLYSSANMAPKNKFRLAAQLLTERGFTAWQVETSRKRRSRRGLGEDPEEWVRLAFAGKTFAQERDDFFSAIDGISELTAGEPLWLWGFSLGGIIALLAAARPDKGADAVILSGTGFADLEESRAEFAERPILSTVEAEISPELSASVRAGFVISFRGSNDDIFSTKSCNDLLNSLSGVPAKRRIFRDIAGAGHSFRERDGVNDPTVMAEMADFLADILKGSEKFQ